MRTICLLEVFHAKVTGVTALPSGILPDMLCGRMQELRVPVMVLRAFNAELAQIPDNVKQEGPGAKSACNGGGTRSRAHSRTAQSQTPSFWQCMR